MRELGDKVASVICSCPSYRAPEFVASHPKAKATKVEGEAILNGFCKGKARPEVSFTVLAATVCLIFNRHPEVARLHLTPTWAGGLEAEANSAQRSDIANTVCGHSPVVRKSGSEQFGWAECLPNFGEA